MFKNTSKLVSIAWSAIHKNVNAEVPDDVRDELRDSPALVSFLDELEERVNANDYFREEFVRNLDTFALDMHEHNGASGSDSNDDWDNENAHESCHGGSDTCPNDDWTNEDNDYDSDNDDDHESCSGGDCTYSGSYDSCRENGYDDGL